jgi:hypothetical protein
MDCVSSIIKETSLSHVSPGLVAKKSRPINNDRLATSRMHWEHNLEMFELACAWHFREVHMEVTHCKKAYDLSGSSL